MNRLNVHDNTETESEGFYVAQRIKQDFEEKRQNYDCLSERLSLDYFDQVNSFDDSLQPWWMNWEVWFKETSVWVSRRFIKKHLVFPPFANHADQSHPESDEQNPHHHNNLSHTVTYDMASKFTPGPLQNYSEDSEQ